MIFKTEIDFGMDIKEEVWKDCKTLGDIYLKFIKKGYEEDEED